MAFNQNTDLPYGLHVARGTADNYSGVHKFGRNPAGSTSFETVWSTGGLYVHPSSATTAVITSSDTVSDNTGTVMVEGLDQNYDIATEVVTIGGSASTTTFLRVNRMYMVTANTGSANVGTITCTVNALTVATIDIGYNQSTMAVYTVPNKYVGYVVAMEVGVLKQKELEGMLMYKPVADSIFRTSRLVTSFGTPFHKDFTIMEQYPEKTDVEIRMKLDVASPMTASFDMLLEYKG